MAKVDKSQYTKSEWHALRQQRRQSKKQPKTVESIPTNQEYNIVCVKQGTKYSANYVNVLRKMVERNTTLQHNFVCLTDDPVGLESDIYVKTLPYELKGWWAKPYVFSDELGLSGVILYLDLDVVIAGSLDKLLIYKPDYWVIVRDFTRVFRHSCEKYNSSVIRFNSGQLDHLWRDFEQNRRLYERKYWGDQDWLYAVANLPAKLWPDAWIKSWKWEIRKSRQFAPGGKRGNRKFRDTETVVPSSECSIAVFHGDPNPELVDDPWVVKNWQ